MSVYVNKYEMKIAKNTSNYEMINVPNYCSQPHHYRNNLPPFSKHQVLHEKWETIFLVTLPLHLFKKKKKTKACYVLSQTGTEHNSRLI